MITQFVWVYWDGGAQSDELRWSMRSVAANFIGESEMLVVGDQPRYYDGPMLRRARVRQQPQRGFRDVLNKIHAACLSDMVRDTFVWMMDDIYFIKPVSLADLSRHYRGGVLPARYKAGSDGWTGLKADTFRVIKSEGLPLVDYCTHLPHVLNKRKWLAMWDKYGLADRVLQWELLYGAEFFRKHYPVRTIRTRVSKTGAVFDTVGRIGNNSNNGWSDKLRETLAGIFPSPSPWEHGTPEMPIDIVTAVRQAISGDSQYFDVAALKTNPVAELDRFADQHNPYVAAEDYREALGLLPAA